MATCLFYVDMLGVRSAWRSGRRAVLGRIVVFESLIVKTAQAMEYPPTAGAIEADSAVIGFDGINYALEYSVALFIRAFSIAQRPPLGDRVWLRGVLSPGPMAEELRWSQRTEVAGLVRYQYEPRLFDAINAEKSGFKGMRLLIADALVTPAIADMTAIPLGNQNAGMPVFNHLKYSYYPDTLPFPCSDVLWCLSSSPQEAAQLNNIMQRRLRWSAADPEEFQQAAATQVLFHETYAQLHARRRAAGIAPPANAYYYPDAEDA